MAVVATGFFDGVHLGHRQVIQALVSCARERGEEAIAITFAQHPRTVLEQDAHALRLLNSPQEKEALLRALGVDRVETLPFDRAFARLGACEYIRDVLMARFGATALVLGYDNRLGSDCLTPDRIKPLAEYLGLEVRIVGAAAAREVVVSSTKIREALEGGDVETARAMLGYWYGLRGVVVGGKHLGREIGYPTANLRLCDPMKLVPRRGVYLTEIEVLGERHWGMTNVDDVLETYIFDFKGDVYGAEFVVRFRHYLREMRALDTLEALHAQLAADEKACRALIARSV
ncbi:MAG: bifunctional riboflavin kinase/FMN adenylyltransferase [Bacteroidales bacterium]|nr:bifunctional riboflavin kinase/FMN adenylyltransferase [Bacteroidales bacterium]